MARNTLAPGGYIGGEPPRRPYFNQLSGVWKLEDAVERQKAGTWANPLGIEDLFSTYLYTGNGSTQTITNGIDLAGEGGLVWTKPRVSATQNDHILVDSERGNFQIQSSTTAANNGIASFNFSVTGYTVPSNLRVNESGITYASWTFRKAAKFFDVVTYAGSGTSQSIAHNLGSEPGFVIIKATSTPSNWVCYHRSLGTGNAVFLNLTNASTAASDISAVSSTTFSVSGSQTRSNESGQTYVAYLFAHDAGGFGDSGNESVIKCDTFTTDGSGLATVNLGWEPQWLLFKSTAVGDNWTLIDAMRGMSYSAVSYLEPNTASTESTVSGNYITPTSTGFSVNANFFGTSRNLIYIAIRRGPMKAPTDGAQVFDVDAQTGGAFVSTGFPVDTSIFRPRSVADTAVVSRITGAKQTLYTNLTNAESTYAGDGILFDKNNGVEDDHYGGGTLIYWNFRRAPGFFDVVAYTGTGANRTVSHNLGVIPELMIFKVRSTTNNWSTYVASIGNNKELNINLNFGSGASGAWNNTTPTSSVFTLGGLSSVNANAATYVAYLFASCPGVSKVGSYTGTGTTLDIDCGFSNGARFVLIKRTDSTGDWYVWDTARGIVSGNDPSLLLNSTAAEVTNTDYIDPLSSGFQISSTAPAAINANGGSYIYFSVA